MPRLQLVVLWSVLGVSCFVTVPPIGPQPSPLVVQDTGSPPYEPGQPHHADKVRLLQLTYTSFKNSGIFSDGLIGSFFPKALLDVRDSNGNGLPCGWNATLDAAALLTAPAIHLQPATDASTISSVLLAMIDYPQHANLLNETISSGSLSSLLEPVAQNGYLCLLREHIQVGSHADAYSSYALLEGSDITPYSSPDPPAGDGAHRIVLAAFASNGDLSQSATSLAQQRGNFNLTAFAEAANLDTPYALSFFIIDAGGDRVLDTYNKLKSSPAPRSALPKSLVWLTVLAFSCASL
ncbi:uncharacterized protein L969DRAFT_54289 [Mixia osmundae IAM 14324]|uniref:Uncharacterized protein n=1 Tax=Mixia osmundae (strain CBS 9802 / IAM 14324 / JCM 22182 / KY 12970) TaxID=764103 RepID=G7E2M3_MIXOS|nr:uncharacterized protein L969DRAFT_54289 [Mixia osmundae IAM 14324]KEI36948.1 hypothetical protein L969DRAFT_54289 [Mixia osmundae IAM 14324]GAA97083.1 hypothetical protein E5Q_03758 [Mixia osmundae IAM 14324]